MNLLAPLHAFLPPSADGCCTTVAGNPQAFHGAYPCQTLADPYICQLACKLRCMWALLPSFICLRFPCNLGHPCNWARYLSPDGAICNSRQIGSISRCRHHGGDLQNQSAFDVTIQRCPSKNTLAAFKLPWALRSSLTTHSSCLGRSCSSMVSPGRRPISLLNDAPNHAMCCSNGQSGA